MDLLFDVRDGVAVITINRPEKRNAINKVVRDGLAEAIEHVEDDSSIKVVILTGAGDRAFSAGADINEASDRGVFEKRRQSGLEASHILRKCSKPVIAMIRGYALGGGCELALACDIRFASETAVFGFPETQLGWIPAAGATQILPRLVGEGRAMELILGGERISAASAHEIGLVNRVVSDDELDDVTFGFAKHLATKKRLQAMQLAKAAMRMASRVGVDAGFEYERELITLCYTFKDRQEGIRAFKERRGPQFGEV